MIDTAFVGQHLDAFTFQRLIEDALAMVPATVDKRQGSVIYDTLAVEEVQRVQDYIRLKGYYLDVYALTAQGAYLDLRVAEMGITRYPATAAVKRGIFTDRDGNPAAIPTGSQLASESDTNALTYTVTAEITDEDGIAIPGYYRLTCGTVGTSGNDYTGALLPITRLPDIATATMDELLIPARDVEDDAALLYRYLEYVNRPPFGGNVSHYRTWVLAMGGVGAVQVYPVWDGGGTVKVSVIGADWLPASDTLIGDVQTALDPEANHAQGLGLAPIGHFVTVSTPEAVPINVQATITLSQGISIGQVGPPTRAAISSYLLGLRQRFGVAGDMNIYSIDVFQSRILSAMIQIDGVLNVTDVLLNGVDGDLILTQTAQLQQLPVEGTVTYNVI